MYLPALLLTLSTTILIRLTPRTDEQILAIQPLTHPTPRAPRRYLQRLRQRPDLRSKLDAVVVKVAHASVQGCKFTRVVENAVLRETGATDDVAEHGRGERVLWRDVCGEVLEGAQDEVPHEVYFVHRIRGYGGGVRLCASSSL
jgi:hypothetical protein